jgi:hypothetical protein
MSTKPKELPKDHSEAPSQLKQILALLCVCIPK